MTWDDYLLFLFFKLDLTNIYRALTKCKVMYKMRWNKVRRHKQKNSLKADSKSALKEILCRQ